MNDTPEDRARKKGEWACGDWPLIEPLPWTAWFAVLVWAAFAIMAALAFGSWVAGVW
jgi:hypothetical protein